MTDRPFHQIAEEASTAMREAEYALERATRAADAARAAAKENDVAKRIWRQRVSFLMRAAVDLRNERRKYS